MGFEEIPHTADWSIRVWGQDLPELFAQAARGMNSLAGSQLAIEQRVKRKVEADGMDTESLLVAFLTELIYTQEHERLGFDQFDIRISDDHLSATLGGGLINSITKTIKAVTYHNLKIEKTERGYEAEIVFDV
jgi:SHS2 domain-containing protein